MRCNAAVKVGVLSILEATALAAPQDSLGNAVLPRETGGRGSNIILAERQLPGNHIESVISAAKSILSAAYPEATPTDLDIRTIEWEPVIDGTTYTPQRTWAPSSTDSLSRTQTSSTSSTGAPTTSASTASETSTSTSRTSTATSSSATETSAETASPGKQYSRDGDRDVAIAVGILVSLLAVALAASILLLMCRRKRKTGQYFKPARCSECLTTPSSSAFGSRLSTTPKRQGVSEPTRSWFTTRTNYLTPALADSAERLPEPVQKAYVRHQSLRLPGDDHILSNHPPTRLQKSNTVSSRTVPEIIDAAGILRPHEVMGDDLTGMVEMDHEEPSRRAAELARLSAIPLIVHQMKELEAEYHNSSGWNGPFSSEDPSKPITELDANSPTRSTSSLWQYAPNPFVVAQLAESEGGYDVVQRDASNDSTRPSELEGGSVSPGSRRISSLMPFANNLVVTQLVDGERDDSMSNSTSNANSDVSPSARPRYTRHQPLVVMSSPAESETTPSTSPPSTQQDSRSGSPADDEMSSSAGEHDRLSPPPPLWTGMRRTEVVMPDRNPSISSPDNSPRCERDQLLSRFKTPKVSPVTPSTTKEQFLPAAGYASSPLWRKRRPAPISPGSIPSPVSNAGSDVTSGSSFRLPPGVREEGPATSYACSPLWKKRRPMPISPGTPSPLLAVHDMGAGAEVEEVPSDERRRSIHPGVLLPGRKSLSESASTEQLRRSSRDSPHPMILLPATTYHPQSNGTQSSQTLPHGSHVQHGLPTPTSYRSKDSLRNFSVTPPAQGLLSVTKESLASGGGLSITPSWSEVNDFNFEGAVKASDGDDGYKPGGESTRGRYELMS